VRLGPVGAKLFETIEGFTLCYCQKNPLLYSD